MCSAPQLKRRVQLTRRVGVDVPWLRLGARQGPRYNTLWWRTRPSLGHSSQKTRWPFQWQVCADPPGGAGLLQDQYEYAKGHGWHQTESRDIWEAWRNATVGGDNAPQLPPGMSPSGAPWSSIYGAALPGDTVGYANLGMNRHCFASGKRKPAKPNFAAFLPSVSVRRCRTEWPLRPAPKAFRLSRTDPPTTSKSTSGGRTPALSGTLTRGTKTTPRRRGRSRSVFSTSSCSRSF